MKNMIAKFQMTTAAMVVLLCCFFILSHGQPVPVFVQSQFDNANILELNGLKQLTNNGKVAGPFSGMPSLLGAFGGGSPLGRLGGIGAGMGFALLGSMSALGGSPVTGVNIGVQCASCGDSPAILQVNNDDVVRTGGTFGKDNVFQIANTHLPNIFKIRYCPAGSGSCRDLVFSPHYLVVDNGRLPDSRPLYFLYKPLN